MSESYLIIVSDDLIQVCKDLIRVGVIRKSHAVTDALTMCIYDDRRNTVYLTDNEICDLPAHSLACHQYIRIIGNCMTPIITIFIGKIQHCGCLGLRKTAWLDNICHITWICREKIIHCLISQEQFS